MGESDQALPAPLAPTSSTARPTIFGGTRDDDQTAIESVVALRVGTGKSFELCTGALVAPNLVLTARHCLVKTITTAVSCDQDGNSINGAHVDEDIDPTTIGVYVGARPTFSRAPVANGKAIVSPRGPFLCDADIAFLVLDGPVANEKPFALRMHDRTDVGETIRAVGYGQTEEGARVGARFRKENVAVLARGKTVSSNGTALGSREFEVGESTCQGDSGGPAISEETGAVVGVVSRGVGCDTNYGHIYTTTAGFDDLVAAAFAEAGAEPVLEAASGSQSSLLRSAGDDGARASAEPTSTGTCGIAIGRGEDASRAVPAFVFVIAVGAAARRRRRPRDETSTRSA